VKLVFRCIQQERIRAVSEAGSCGGTKAKVVVMALEPCPKAMRLIMSSLWMGTFVSIEGSWTAGDGARAEQIPVWRCVQYCHMRLADCAREA
jgi:hypothetical protein